MLASFDFCRNSNLFFFLGRYCEGPRLILCANLVFHLVVLMSGKSLRPDLL